MCILIPLNGRTHIRRPCAPSFGILALPLFLMLALPPFPCRLGMCCFVCVCRMGEIVLYAGPTQGYYRFQQLYEPADNTIWSHQRYFRYQEGAPAEPLIGSLVLYRMGLGRDNRPAAVEVWGGQIVDELTRRVQALTWTYRRDRRRPMSLDSFRRDIWAAGLLPAGCNRRVLESIVTREMVLIVYAELQ